MMLLTRLLLLVMSFSHRQPVGWKISFSAQVWRAALSAPDYGLLCLKILICFGYDLIYLNHVLFCTCSSGGGTFKVLRRPSCGKCPRFCIWSLSLFSEIVPPLHYPAWNVVTIWHSQTQNGALTSVVNSLGTIIRLKSVEYKLLDS